MNVSNTIITIIQIRDQVQIYHWQTNIYARHKAADKLYKNLNENLDKFVETIQNKTHFSLNRVYKLPLSDIDDNEMNEILEKFADFLYQLSFTKRSDLSNIRDEMLANVNQTLYLFSLT